MKKEYLSDRAKYFNEKSDTELIDHIADYDYHQIEGAKAILDKRLKRTIQYLTEVIQKSNEATEIYNERLERLTRWILILTMIITFVTLVNIFKTPLEQFITKFM